MLRWLRRELSASLRDRLVSLLLVLLAFLISVVGIVLAVFSTSYVLANGTTLLGGLLALITVISALIVVVGLARVLRTDISVADLMTVGTWTFAGVVVFELILLVIAFYQQAIGGTVSRGDFIATSVLGAGVAGGFVVGVYNVQTARAERTARRRYEHIEFLNSVLRHDLLNDHNLIQGQAALLAETASADQQEYVDRIAQRSGDATSTIRTIRSVIDVVEDETPTLRSMDLMVSVREELNHIHETYPDAVVTIVGEPPDRVSVRANNLLGRVFTNLFRNAVEHNDTAQPRLAVTVTERERDVRVTIADNGPGLPDTVFDAFRGATTDWDRLLDAGYGLYLVAAIVDSYGGDLWVEENDPEGTIVTVALPKS